MWIVIITRTAGSGIGTSFPSTGFGESRFGPGCFRLVTDLTSLRRCVLALSATIVRNLLDVSLFFQLKRSCRAEVALVDVDTENPSVQSSLNDWISGFVKEYAIDGLRLDGQSLSCRIPPFCGAQLMKVRSTSCQACRTRHVAKVPGGRWRLFYGRSLQLVFLVSLLSHLGHKNDRSVR